MTLMDFLEGLRADPREPNGPMLIVGEGNLTKAQREQVLGPTYARRPYAVVVGLQRGLPRPLHNRITLMVGGVDVHVHHPANQLKEQPDGEALAALQAQVLMAQSMVTEIRDGYPLAGRFGLATELDPHPFTMDNLDGLRAVTRFTYSLWR